MVAAAVAGGSACVQVLFFRNGRSLGNKAFFPRTPDGADAAEVLAAFLPQYYLRHDPPARRLWARCPEGCSLALGRRAVGGTDVRAPCPPWLIE